MLLCPADGFTSAAVGLLSQQEPWLFSCGIRGACYGLVNSALVLTSLALDVLVLSGVQQLKGMGTRHLALRFPASSSIPGFPRRWLFKWFCKTIKETFPFAKILAGDASVNNNYLFFSALAMRSIRKVIKNAICPAVRAAVCVAGYLLCTSGRCGLGWYHLA